MCAMRVVFAPDKFAGTLTALEAAQAMAAGWRRHDPDLVADVVPMADGGPGFVEVLHTSLGGELVEVTVRGPHGTPTRAEVLLVGETAYVESAQANGLHLAAGGNPRRASTHGVGELVAEAIDLGARRIVLGVGGSGTTDGGAGMLGALGAVADGPLDQGPDGLAHVTKVDLRPVWDVVDEVELVLASDVDNPLTGMFGAAKVYGPQKGIAEDEVAGVDAILERFGALCDRRTSLRPGAGAAGGLGFAALLLDAERRPGFAVVAEAVGLSARVMSADLVVTGEGSFDLQSGAGKTPYGVAQVAQRVLRPCVVIAGRVDVGARESRALGMDGAYSLSEVVGQELAFADPAAAVAQVAERVARSWVPA